MNATTIKDIDGKVYRITWSPDERSAEVTLEGDDSSPFYVFAVKRAGQTSWFSTETGEAQRTPADAVLNALAEHRRRRSAVPSILDREPEKPKKSWRDLIDDKKPVTTGKKENKWHHRKDFD